jgi:hypothetical protein
MRLLSRAVIAVAALVLAAPAIHAQTSFSVAIGAAVPMGDAADAVEMGYNATLGIGIKPPLAPLGLRVEGMFNSFAFKSALLDGESNRVMGVTANGTFSFAPQIYGIAGIGMYNSKASVTGASSNTDFGFNIGAGVNIPLTGFGTFVEARFHHVASDGGNFQFIPITVGIKF